MIDKNSFNHLQVQHLYPLVSRLRISPNTDYYELWSIVSLIDTCVGNETLCQTDMVSFMDRTLIQYITSYFAEKLRIALL